MELCSALIAHGIMCGSISFVLISLGEICRKSSLRLFPKGDECPNGRGTLQNDTDKPETDGGKFSVVLELEPNA